MTLTIRPKPTVGKTRALIKNLGQVRRDFFVNALPDPFPLKRNTLILSSLLLVISRVVIVNRSARQAKGHSEEHYRQNEAIKTSMREIGGFSLSFLVLRLIESIAKTKLLHIFGLPKEQKLIPHTWNHFKRALSEGLQNRYVKPDQIYIDPDFKPPVDPSKMLTNYKRFRLDRLFLNNHKAFILPEPKQIAQITKNIEHIIAFGPTLIGSIPAVLLSGYFLEWFTQKHANTVAEKLIHKLHKDNPSSNYPHSGRFNPTENPFAASSR